MLVERKTSITNDQQNFLRFLFHFFIGISMHISLQTCMLWLQVGYLSASSLAVTVPRVGHSQAVYETNFNPD